MFETSSDDIRNDDFVSAIIEGVIDVVNKALFSALLDDTLFVCAVIGLVLVSAP
jgi:hypothetical protein